MLVVPGDVTKDADIKAIVESTVEQFGGIDVVVNNAGSLWMGGLTDSSPEDLKEAYDLHVVGAFRMAKEARPHLIKSKGMCCFPAST